MSTGDKQEIKVTVVPTMDIQLESLAEMVGKIIEKNRKKNKISGINICMSILAIVLPFLTGFIVKKSIDVTKAVAESKELIANYEKAKNIGPIIDQISKFLGPWVDTENIVQNGHGAVNIKYFLTKTDLIAKKGESIQFDAKGKVCLGGKDNPCFSPISKSLFGLKVVIGNIYSKPIPPRFLTNEKDNWYRLCIDKAPRNGPVYFSIPDGVYHNWQEVYSNVYVDNTGKFNIKEFKTTTRCSK